MQKFAHCAGWINLTIGIRENVLFALRRFVYVRISRMLLRAFARVN